MRPLGLIPARGGSKRLPRKNLALLRGRPLLAYAIDAARLSGLFDDIVVSTEDSEIADVARSYGAVIPFMRPNEWAVDAVALVDVCLHAVTALAEQGQRYDALCLLVPTSPLRTADDIRGAWNAFRESGASFLMSVTDFDHSPFLALRERDGGALEPFWGHDFIRQSQDLPRVVRHNGAVVIADVAALLRERTLYGNDLRGYYMPRLRSIDVDHPDDLILADCLMARLAEGAPGASFGR